jgi:hypothetical protein
VQRIGVDQLTHVLAGMPYPAAFWQVIAWADYNGVDSQLREIMRKLPAKTYLSLRDVAVSLEQCQLPPNSGNGSAGRPPRPA